MKVKHIFLIAIVALMTLELKTSAAPDAIPTPSNVARQAVLTARDPGSDINVRKGPATRYAAPYYGLAGDRVEVLNKAQDDDGYTWYYVKLAKNVANGWVRGDFVRFVEGSQPPVGVNPELRPVPAPTNPNSTNPSINPLPDRNSVPTGGYTPEQVEYFLEVALGSEFGSNIAKIKKWEGAVKIKVNGSPTTTDLETLQQVMGEINTLVNGAIRLEFDDANPNVQIYFVPQSQFKRYEPNYRPRNSGFAWVRWQQRNIIQSANVLISTTGVTQKHRSHLIREELTQSLGLMKDSLRYRDSIFFQGRGDTTVYAEIDKALIQMLYRPEILPGSGRAEVLAALRTLTASVDRPNRTTSPIQGTTPMPMESPLDFSPDAPLNN